MKILKKPSLSAKVIESEVKKYEKIGRTPLIKCEICLGKRPELECNSTAIQLLCEALGEPVAAEWLEKWRAKFDEDMRGAVAELEEAVKTAKAARL